MDLNDQDITLLSSSFTSDEDSFFGLTSELEDNCKMFLPPPRRHELEIIEKHLSLCNNLDFINKVHNPPAIYQYLISLVKNMGS